jgi:hypothetical protein
MRLLLLIVCLFSTGLVAVSHAAEPTNWRIRHFEVVQTEPTTPISNTARRLAGMPANLVGEISPATAEVLTAFMDVGYFLRDWALNPVMLQRPLTPAIKADVENFLEGAANMLQQWGFPEPHLNDIVTRADGKEAYRVYYTDLTLMKNAAGLYDPGLWGLPALFVDAASIADANGVTARGYGTIAHELFHAVQSATPFLRLVGVTQGHYGSDAFHQVNPWIREGSADAVGDDIARKLRPGIENHRNQYEQWGQRNYSHELVVERSFNPFDPIPSTMAYHTSSVWRYLAEVNRAKEVPRRYANYPGSRVHPVDYSYLSTFFQQTTPINSGNDELDWLDAVTRGYKNFKVPFRDYFAEFLVAYTMYGAHRPGTVSRHEQLSTDPGRNWRKRSFELLLPGGEPDPIIEAACHPVHIQNPTRYWAVPFHIRRNAGTCFAVFISDFDPETSVTVSLNAFDVKRLAQLRIGVAGELRTSKTAWAVNIEDVARTRHNYRLPLNKENIFVVSNMASQPSATVDQTAALVFAIGGFETSESRPQGTGGTTDPNTTDDSEAQTRERMARAAPRVTKNGPGTAIVKRRERQREIIISLGSVPEAYQMFDEVNLSGSQAGQSRGHDTARQAMSANPATLAAVTEALARDDRMSITIPLVDYGFAGTFKKAEFKLKRNEDQELFALDPVSRDPNGQVTITEYSAEFLSGTFSAQLVEKYEHTGSGFRRIPRDEPLTIVKNISGRFWIPTPWLTDPRGKIEPVDTLPEDIAADITQWMPGDMTSDIADRLRQAIRTNPGPPTSNPSPPPMPGPSPSAAGANSTCSCDCQNMSAEAPVHQCQTQCQIVWATCETTASQDLLDRQIAELRNLLSNSGADQSTQDMIVENFKQIPPGYREAAMEANRKALQRN